jgi:hypothetical protein
MFKVYFKNYIVIFSLLPVLAIAGTGEIKISEVRVESGNVYIFTTNVVSNSLSCGLSSPIKLEPADAGFKEMYSASLTALASGKSIKFWLRSCVSSPWGKTIPKAYASGLLAK